MTEIGQEPVHFPHWIQGNKGSLRIFANRSDSVDIYTAPPIPEGNRGEIWSKLSQIHYIPNKYIDDFLM